MLPPRPEGCVEDLWSFVCGFNSATSLDVIQEVALSVILHVLRGSMHAAQAIDALPILARLGAVQAEHVHKAFCCLRKLSSLSNERCRYCEETIIDCTCLF